VPLTTISLPGMKLWILASIDDSFARRPMSACSTAKDGEIVAGDVEPEPEAHDDVLSLDNVDGCGRLSQHHYNQPSPQQMPKKYWP